MIDRIGIVVEAIAWIGMGVLMALWVIWWAALP